MNYRIFRLILLLMLLTFLCKSQDKTMYFLDFHSICNQMNPAVNFNRSLIIIDPSLRTSFASSSLSFYDIFEKGKNGNGQTRFYWDFDQIEKKIHKTNALYSSAAGNLFFAGIDLKNGFYGSVSASKKTELYFAYPNTFFDLRYGNADFDTNKARPIDLNNYSFNGFLYNELSFGLSKNISENFSVGLHLKLLQGKLGIITRKFNVSITTLDDFSKATLKTDATVELSAPLIISNTENKKLEIDNNELKENFTWPNFTLKNIGIAADLGFVWDVNTKFRLTGSLLDFGSIRWGKSPQQLVSKGEYVFNGIYFTTKDIKHFDFDTIPMLYFDTLATFFWPRSGREAFHSNLFAKFYLGSSYKMSPKLSVTGLVKASFMKEIVLLDFTAGLLYSPYKKWTFSANWSYDNWSLYNIGIGVLFTHKRLQAFAATDNINALDLLHSRAINSSIGVNYILFQSFGKSKMGRITNIRSAGG